MQIFQFSDNNKAGKKTVERLKNYRIKTVGLIRFHHEYRDINESLVALKGMRLHLIFTENRGGEKLQKPTYSPA